MFIHVLRIPFLICHQPWEVVVSQTPPMAVSLERTQNARFFFVPVFRQTLQCFQCVASGANGVGL